jgi:hypothetical protein
MLMKMTVVMAAVIPGLFAASRTSQGLMAIVMSTFPVPGPTIM